MRAVVNTPDGAAPTEIRAVDTPDPQPDEALVEVHAFGLNRGELTLLARRPEGWRPGQDVGGVVLRAAADASGPPQGARVVAQADQGGWAEQAAVPTSRLATIPGTVSFEQAATLPVAGLTALRTLRLGGALLGQAVLLTAANGGVGRFQVELAAAAGARVTAVARPEHAEDLRALGAETVVAEVGQAAGLFGLIAESVGGTTFTAAIDKLEPGGLIVWFGNSSREPMSIGGFEFRDHANARVHFFFVYGTEAAAPFGPDLQLLATLVGQDRLHPSIGFTADWSQVSEAVAALRERRVPGKAVLTVTH